MQTKIPTILFLMVIILITSCKKKEVSEFTDTPIIESYLEPGNYLNVKISRQIPFSSNVSYSSDDINNLNVQVTSNNSTHTLHPLGNGKYIDSSVTVSEGANYNLSFQFNSKNIKAYTDVPSKPASVTQSVTDISIHKMDSASGPPTGTQPDPVKITWSNPDNSYYLII